MRPSSTPNLAVSAEYGGSGSRVGGLIAFLLTGGIGLAGVCFGRVVEHFTHGASMDGIAAANATAPYGLIIGAFAALRNRPVRAGVDAAVFFSAFVIGYYWTVARERGIWAVDRHYAAVWLLLAVAVCPMLAAALTWARQRSGPLRAVLFALPAGAACTEVVSGRTWGMASSIGPVVIAMDIVLIATYLLLLPRGMVTKAASVVWTAPVATVMVVVTTHLAERGTYQRWMY